ncbi:hypothetical protein F5148DRAFT_1152784 [Russula earlei]|uniref:Uncharacterized protein n=1 Tax=Russula earlei TaxID=71964 RepID=A0ACC0TVA6_9AGAM|nr:hypothetical protein F5148DRAFT_1152784 [Russula earlei]
MMVMMGQSPSGQSLAAILPTTAASLLLTIAVSAPIPASHSSLQPSAMLPNNRHITKPSGMSLAKTSDKEDLLRARDLKRTERVEAEKRTEAGNAHFRAGEYLKAIVEYDAAIMIHGSNPAYLSNMAAVWLKLEVLFQRLQLSLHTRMDKYDHAEASAGEALVLDPRFTKARYRRGLARKGNLELARAALVEEVPSWLSQGAGTSNAQADHPPPLSTVLCCLPQSSPLNATKPMACRRLQQQEQQLCVAPPGGTTTEWSTHIQQFKPAWSVSRKLTFFLHDGGPRDSCSYDDTTQAYG